MSLYKLSTLALIALLSGCDKHDSDFYPYTMTGLQVFVYDNATSKEHFAGMIESGYFGRVDATRQCASTAANMARQLHLRDWGYVCCTVTSSSSCVTKVR